MSFRHMLSFYPIKGSRVHLSKFMYLCHCRRKTIKTQWRAFGNCRMLVASGIRVPADANPSILMNILKRSFCRNRAVTIRYYRCSQITTCCNYHISRKLKTSIKRARRRESRIFIDGRGRASQENEFLFVSHWILTMHVHANRRR